MEIVICVCAVSTDLAVIVFTWRRTYKLWRDGVKYKMSTPLTTLVLRDGKQILVKLGTYAAKLGLTNSIFSPTGRCYILSVSNGVLLHGLQVVH